VAAFLWPVRVYYEDTDAGGVVFHSNYLNFLERGRTEWLRTLGLEQDRLSRIDGIIFVVRHITIDFVRSARFNQCLLVEVSVSHANRLSVEFTQRILLQNGDGAEPHADADNVVCRAQVKIVTLDAETLRPQRMPNSIYAEIKRGHGS